MDLAERKHQVRAAAKKLQYMPTVHLQAYDNFIGDFPTATVHRYLRDNGLRSGYIPSTMPIHGSAI